MSRIALYFASGESLYLGTVLLALAAVASPFLKRTWLLRARNVAAWIALAFIVMACPPFTFVVDLIFLAVFLLWFITSNRSSATLLQWGSTLLLTAMLIVLSLSSFLIGGCQGLQVVPAMIS